MLNQPFFIPAMIFFLLSFPLILGLIPRQWAIGIRTRKTLSDENIWVQANRFAGWAMLVSSVIYLAVAGTLPCMVPCGVNFSEWLLHLAMFGLPLLMGLLLTRLYIESL